MTERRQAWPLQRCASQFLLCFLLIAGTAPALALERREQRNVQAIAGQETRLAAYGTPNEKCEGGPKPTIELVDRPSHGTLTDKNARIVAERANVPRRDHPCLGRFIDAVAVIYVPAAKFRGSDRVRLRVKFDSTQAAPATTFEEEIFISVR